MSLLYGTLLVSHSAVIKRFRLIFEKRFSITPIVVVRDLSFQIAEVMEEEGAGNFGFV